MTKPPILSVERRKEIKEAATRVAAQNPSGSFIFIEACLSFIAELEIKEALIEQLRPVRETRCSTQAILPSGIYRCVHEGRDHTEHQFNYFRSMTKQEKEQYFPEPKGGT